MKENQIYGHSWNLARLSPRLQEFEIEPQSQRGLILDNPESIMENWGYRASFGHVALAEVPEKCNWIDNKFLIGYFIIGVRRF